jgi:hypothetical protein
MGKGHNQFPCAAVGEHQGRHGVTDTENEVQSMGHPQGHVVPMNKTRMEWIYRAKGVKPGQMTIETYWDERATWRGDENPCSERLVPRDEPQLRG